MEKTYKIYSGGWQVQSGYPIRFVYDGWNVVLVLNGNNETVRKYTWGLDLSQSIHGAGGIGGLLACEEPQAVGDPKRYWFLYDANGNVGQVLDATDTNSITIAAHYEYDPYGNLINSSGTYADDNPIRFSTKWFDAEIHLGYWGYRSYSPRLGRWISRDPIGERGGLNSCAFVANQPTNESDFVGLWNTGDTGVHGGLTETWAEAAGMGNAHCRRQIRRWNEGVDNATPAAGGWYEYHFDIDTDGQPYIHGRSYWADVRWQQALDILLPIAPNTFAYGLRVDLGLARAGEALHHMQDATAHQAGGRDPSRPHLAASAFDHAPRVYCTFFPLDHRCAAPPTNSPNWDDPHRPDRESYFPLDVDAAREETIARIAELMSIPAVACRCRR